MNTHDGDNLPYETTARGKTIVFAPPRNKDGQIFGSPMSEEQLMWLSVILLGIAEQDPTYVVSERFGGERAKLERDRVSSQARLWVLSSEFDELCDAANLPVSYLRTLTPARAHEAFEKLRQNNFRVLETLHDATELDELAEVS